MTSLKINRMDDTAAKFRKYKIIVDGENKGTIKNGKIVEIPIQPGDHELYLKIDWGRSNKIAFKIADGEQVQFRCCYRGNGANFIRMFYYTFINPQKYLLLEEVNDFWVV